MDSKELAYRLRKYRTDKKLSAEELAACANTSESNVRRIESGERGTTLGTLVNLAQALNISPSCLLENQAPKSPDFLKDYLRINISNLTGKEVHLLRVIMEVLSIEMSTEISDDLLVGRRIRKCREAEGLSVRRLSQMIGISDVVLRNMEIGKTPVSIAVLKSISAALDVSLDYLLSDVSKEAELSVLNEIMEKSHEMLSEEDFALMRNTYFYMIDGFPKKPKDD